MARKIIGTVAGPTGGWRRRWGGPLALVFIAAAGLIFVQTLQAVHDTGAFELEGNAVRDSVDDWADVYANTDSADVASFTNDGALNATIFTGGGSKDPQDIDQWAWKDQAGGLPDKDNLLDTFAARYTLPGTAPGGTCPNGTGDLNQNGVIDGTEVPFDASVDCVVLFFGSDRYDNSGDAQQGFWFLQKRIGLGTNPKGGGSGFTGLHEPGDLLIISDFSNGGTTSTISVYVWDPTVSGNLRLLQSSAAANCATAASGDPFCGIVNPTNGTTSPWPFLDKSGNSTFLQGEFYEGGVNLSLLGFADECFSSVASETRSSTSTTATLKDFVLGQFAVCGASLTTTPKVGATLGGGQIVAPGTSVQDVATVQGSGTANPPTPTGDVTFYLCGPIATGTCTTGGDLVGSPVPLSDASPPAGKATATSEAVSKTAPGRYCFRAEWPGDDNYVDGPYVHSGTNDSECFIVQDTTSASSAQNWLPNDSATITSANGTALNGSLEIKLYSGDNCGATSGSAVTGQTYTFTLTNAASPATRTTTNTTFTVTASGSYSWKVSFTSTDPYVTSSLTKCEKTTLTIDNGS